jgi:hypothetical protein
MKSAVFILGAARSGTRLLRAILAAAPDVAAVPYDVNYIWRFGNESLPHDAIPADGLSRRQIEFIRHRLCRCAKLSAGQILVEKTVGNILRVPFVARVYPEARFILLMRDGRDVVESAERCWRQPPRPGYLLKKLHTFPWLSCRRYALAYVRQWGVCALRLSDRLASWGPRYPGIDADVRRLPLWHVCCRQWIACIEAFEDARSQLSDGQLLQVRYEQLVDDPRREVTKIGRFVGSNFGREMLAFATRHITHSARCRYARFSPEIQASIEQALAPVLRRWDYLPSQEIACRSAPAPGLPDI